MPQSNGVPLPVRPIIDAGVPKNISASDRAELQKKWNALAEKRRMAVELETHSPTEATRVLKFELRQFGRHWQAYVREGGKLTPLLASPSLVSSALDVLYDAMLDQAQNR